MRVGTLVANGTTIGSGAPRVVIQDFAASDMDWGDVSPVGSVDIAGGRWFVSASFTIDAVANGQARCELWVDRSPRDVGYLSQGVGESMALLETAVGTLTRTSIRLSIACQGDGAYNFQPRAQDIRITALGLGTLVSSDSYGNVEVLGSGTPKALHLAASPRAITRQTWFPIASLDLTQGAWMVLAKAEVDRGPVTCRVEALFDWDPVPLLDTYYGDIGLAVARRYTDPGKTRFRCLAPDASSSNAVVIRAIKLTAFSLGSLTRVAI